MKQALLIIDIQNDYFNGGAMELVGSKEASHQAALLIETFRQQEKQLIFLQHIASEQASFFRPNSKGVLIHSSVKPLKTEWVIQKSYPNSFRDTELLSLLQKEGIQELIICGMMTHMCVDTTVRAAYDLGFSCILIGEACATKDLEFEGKTVTSKEVQMAYLGAIDGTFAQVRSVGAFMENRG